VKESDVTDPQDTADERRGTAENVPLADTGTRLGSARGHSGDSTLGIIDARQLTIAQSATLLRLLKRDPIHDNSVSIEIRWRDGEVESTRIRPETAHEIAELLK